MVRAHGAEYSRAYHPGPDERAVLDHIAACRTAALGGHVQACDHCGVARIAYNSCRDRHCPKCQSVARAQWVTERLERLLPTAYVHVVFTLPHELHAVALHNKKTVFDILFAAASRTLLAIAADPRHLGADVGFTAVLHTWGQTLQFHPHLHCVVTAGGLSPDATAWVSARQRFFLPVTVLAALFRGKALAAIDAAWRAGALVLQGCADELADPRAWRRLKDALYAKDWVVYAKPPFGSAEHVFRYLGNYTHRIAISNHRLLELADGAVRFTYKDYANAGRRKTMTLQASEFLRRFLLHVLPPGYVRIRHYGLCAPANVNGKLAVARQVLDPGDPWPDPTTAGQPDEPHPWWERFREQTGVDVLACPLCGIGRMVHQRFLTPAEAAELAAVLAPATIDTS